MMGGPRGWLCARAGVGATATVGIITSANAVMSEIACAAGVLRRTLVVISAFIMSVRDREPSVQPTDGRPPIGSTRAGITSDCPSLRHGCDAVRSGRMRQQRGRAFAGRMDAEYHARC